jgi:hypothetical protein
MMPESEDAGHDAAPTLTKEEKMMTEAVERIKRIEANLGIKE